MFCRKFLLAIPVETRTYSTVTRQCQSGALPVRRFELTCLPYPAMPNRSKVATCRLTRPSPLTSDNLRLSLRIGIAATKLVSPNAHRYFGAA